MQEDNIVVSPNNKQRNSSIELCRILTMLMIVGCHFATHGGFSYDINTITIPRLWWHVLEMGGNFGVDVFILISGYYLINRTSLNTNGYKIIKICGQALFYSIGILLVWSLSNKRTITISQIVKAFFPITTGAWWFLTTYFLLFLFHPYLNRVLLSLEKRQYQRLIIFLLVIWCIIPTFTTYKFDLNALLEFVMFYTIAGYIRLHLGNRNLKSKHFFLLWVLASLITYLSSVVLMSLGESNTVIYFRRQSLPTLLRAIFFFMIFERMTITSNKMINHISASMFGVYLIHDNRTIRSWLWKTVFANAQYQDSTKLIPYSIIVIIIVFIGCSLIDMFRIGTIEKLFMRFAHRVADWFEKTTKNRFISKSK